MTPEQKLAVAEYDRLLDDLVQARAIYERAGADVERAEDNVERAEDNVDRAWSPLGKPWRTTER